MLSVRGPSVVPRHSFKVLHENGSQLNKTSDGHLGIDGGYRNGTLTAITRRTWRSSGSVITCLLLAYGPSS